jgi:hypothetical protein
VSDLFFVIVFLCSSRIKIIPPCMIMVHNFDHNIFFLMTLTIVRCHRFSYLNYSALLFDFMRLYTGRMGIEDLI